MKLLIRETSHKNKFTLSLDTEKEVLGVKQHGTHSFRQKKKKKKSKTCTNENKILNFKLQEF